MYLDKNERFLIAATKKSKSVQADYWISMNPDDFESKKNYVGKIKSNVMGTMFDIWDNGVKFEKAKNNQEIRESRGVVTYVNYILIKESKLIWVKRTEKNECLFT